MVIDSDAELLDNDMIYRLAPPCELKDISWIKGGMSTWDWETSFTLDDVKQTSVVATYSTKTGNVNVRKSK